MTPILCLDSILDWLDIGLDGNASDMSGNENHGIVNGAKQGADRFGMVGQAYNFDGVDDFIDVGNNIVLNLPSSLSISLWVRNPQGTILSKGLSLKPLVSRKVMDLINILISTGKTQTVGIDTLSQTHLLILQHGTTFM